MLAPEAPLLSAAAASPTSSLHTLCRAIPETGSHSREKAERIIAASGGCGSADAGMDVAVKHAEEREVFGRPIGANQAIQFPLAQIKAKTELARLMTYKAAWRFDQGLP